jgi:acetyl esterase/lipase
VAHRPTLSKSTFPYKRAGGVSIDADIYRVNTWDRRPVVVWIHGGALINGHRDWVPDWLLNACSEVGFIVVSVDYRLAPETKLPEIVSDIEDMFGWLRDSRSRPFSADPERIAVVGESAGGYLALTAGFRVDPRLSAVVSLWGYGDLIGPWYSEPSLHPCHHEVEMSPEEAYQQVSGPPIADARRRDGDGSAFYQFCRQRGLWPMAVSGWDPRREAEKFQPWMPAANVTVAFPPTLLIHGERDTDVPHEQSALMAKEFAEHDVEHRLISIAGAEHVLAGAEPQVVDDAIREAVTFLERHLDSR